MKEHNNFFQINELLLLGSSFLFVAEYKKTENIDYQDVEITYETWRLVYFYLSEDLSLVASQEFQFIKSLYEVNMNVNW